MDSRVLFLSCVLLVACISAMGVAGNPHSRPQETQSLDKESTYGGALSNLLVRRSKREPARLAGGSVVNVPRPCSEPRMDLCPYPELPGLCENTADSSPCSDTGFLTTV